MNFAIFVGTVVRVPTLQRDIVGEQTKRYAYLEFGNLKNFQKQHMGESIVVLAHMRGVLLLYLYVLWFLRTSNSKT